MSMPLRYSSELAEHHAVRNGALTGQPSKIATGRARYSMPVHETGGVLDDLVGYRLAEARDLVVANASNARVVYSTLRDRSGGFAAAIQDASNDGRVVVFGKPGGFAGEAAPAAYLPAGRGEPGTKVLADIRGARGSHRRHTPLLPPPFYRRRA